MSHIHNFIAVLLLLATLLFLSGCGTSTNQKGTTSTSTVSSGSGSGSSSSSPGSSGSGSGSGGSASAGSGSGGSNSVTGNFAAGIGGSGQTKAAQFLVAVQIPDYFPIPTKINSDGTLSSAKLNAPPAPYTQNTPRAMDAAIDPSGNFLYEAVSSGIYGYTINRQTGDLTEMANFPIAASQNFEAITVDQLGKFVYAYGGGQLFAYTVQAGSGQLSPIPGSPFSATSSGQQYYLASNRLAVTQNNQYLYVATSTGIFGFSIDQNTGALTPVPGSPFGGSAGTAFALVAPANGFLYETVTATSPQPTSGIFAYSVNPNTGALSDVPGSPFGPGCPADNLTSPSNGKFLFAASCGMYSVDPTTGALAQISKDPSTRNSVWAVFDPPGRFVWLVTTGQNCWHCDIGVTSYQVDAQGDMTQVPNSFFIMQNDMTGGIQSLAITH